MRAARPFFRSRYDIYRYGSKDRRRFKKQYYHLVQDHHIIPKEFKEHNLLKKINYDINSSNNLIIMPSLKGITNLKLNNDLQTHYKGHPKYNSFIKTNLDIINKCNLGLDSKKYKFWLFYIFLKKNCITKKSTIPWIE